MIHVLKPCQATDMDKGRDAHKVAVCMYTAVSGGPPSFGSRILVVLDVQTIARR